MKQLLAFGMMVVAALSASGCARMSTKIVEKPRVDQELGGTGSEGGNQGYLMGKAPDAGPRKKTRQMLQTDIELPTKDEINPWRKGAKAPEQAQTAQAPVPQLVQPPAPSPAWEDSVESREQDWKEPAPAHGKDWSGTTYTVQKGDTLQKISSKFYGSTKPWREIFEANQASMKSPNHIYPGQKLVIPPREEVEEEARSQKGSSQEEYK